LPRRCLLLAIAWALGACSSSTPAAAPARTPVTAPSSAALDAAALQRAIDAHFEAGEPAGLENVRALLVSVDGATVAARYSGSGPEEAAHVWSVTKSVLSMLVGIALDEGHLRGLDQTLAELLPQYRSQMRPAVAAITLQQLLSMTSGLADASDGGVVFDPADPDLVRTILQGALVAEPGTRWLYSNASAHVLSAVLRHATGQSVLDYARARLFDPLEILTRPGYEGVENLRYAPPFSDDFQRAGFAWATDQQGVHVGGLTLKITAPDMVKLGELYLGEGTWHGRRIVPAQWVQTSITPVELASQEDGSSYGLLWWLFELTDTARTPRAAASVKVSSSCPTCASWSPSPRERTDSPPSTGRCSRRS
jgi:CubicO group peptidase (beta-lactamase class C family)